MHDKLFIGMSGLSTDVSTLYVPKVFLALLGFACAARRPLSYTSDRDSNRDELFRFKMNMYKLREERLIKPETFANVVASTLYEKRCVEVVEVLCFFFGFKVEGSSSFTGKY
eukprot:SAG11_NODE_965_length_6360_cov_11.622584_7_plen_112_part_00